MRKDNWDFYKGLLMFSVVFGHTITALVSGANVSIWLYKFLRTFDMPMFAWISGYYLKISCKNYSVTSNLLNKVGTILFPAVLWSGIINLLMRTPFFQQGRIWFLWSIFFVSVIIIFVDFFRRCFRFDRG